MSCQDVNIQGLVSGAGFGGDFMYVLFCFKQQQEAEVPCSQLAKKFRTRKNKKGEGRRKKKKVAKTQVSKYVRNTAGSTSHASHEPHSQSRQPRATQPHSHALPHTPHGRPQGALGLRPDSGPAGSPMTGAESQTAGITGWTVASWGAGQRQGDCPPKVRAANQGPCGWGLFDTEPRLSHGLPDTWRPPQALLAPS